MEIKKFITCAVPVNICNFHCQYCYLRNYKKREKTIDDFIFPPEKLVQYLSIERLGGVCYFNFCGDGETLLHPQIIPLVSLLLQEGHFCDIITNGTMTKKFDFLINTLSAKQREKLLIKFSFHWRELIRTGLLDEFANNIRKCKKAGISYSIEITPEDALIPHIDVIMKYSIDTFGALPHITVARDESDPELSFLTKLSKDEYVKTWGRFNSELFNFKIKHFGIKRTEFCYAGQWSIYVNLKTGIYRQCYDGRVLGNITDDGSLHLCPVGRCASPHCYNCHAFLTLGTIPKLEAPSYTMMRDRISTNGEHWINEKGRIFFSAKLKDSNVLISPSLKNCLYLIGFLRAAYCSFKRCVIKVLK